ncbi:hypothetical protein FT641_18300 [Bacillus paranthracis]|uniref:hypothetical protein n=1 Tax=Bacillus paranthracis TaxID=2026186 RepID=UPI0018791F25|nr:hypothetical protein [Bacillus paranthracis]MBE7114485.1 hypothetical protein [Bacillus paranthracis]MBE7154641.1 hypothetical protein [Bacillus paranthracis]
MGASAIVMIWLSIGLSTFGFDSDGRKAAVQGTCMCLLITFVCGTVVYTANELSSKDVKTASETKVEEVKKSSEEDKNKLYLLLERELNEDRDRMIIEDVDDFKKVTTKSGIYKVKLKNDVGGSLEGIDSVVKITD